LVCEKEKSVCPVSDHAFLATQSPQSLLETKYIGCKVFSRNGEVREIQSIKRLGVWGDGIGRKIVSALTGAYSLRVEFLPCGSVELEEFKLTIEEFLSLDNSSEDPHMPQLEPIGVVLEKVRGAPSVERIFDCINMPEAEDCLDVL
jgi:hypothetical protein